MQKRTPILKLKGIEDRGAAEALVDAEAYALVSESRPDEDGAWLVSDLIGLEVFVLGDESASIGRLKGLIDNPAHDILEIEAEGRALMLPFIDTFVSEVDTAGGRIVIDPPEGWLEP